MRASTKVALLLSASAALVLFELWPLAVLALVWCYFTWIGDLDDTVLGKTRAGMGLMATGALLSLLSGDDVSLYRLSVALIVIGWGLVAAEPGRSSPSY